MKALWLLAFVMAIATGCASEEERKGREDALRNIETGNARIMGFGLPRFEVGDLEPALHAGVSRP